MNFVCDEPTLQQCRRCRGWFDREVGFRKNPRRLGVADISATGFRPVCIGCEQTTRDDRKRDDPFMVKASSTTRRHAARYKLSTTEFIRRFGWDIPRVAHLLRHAFDNTCEYCRKPYSGTKVCCQTCNREKSATPPELWARKLRYYAAWERHQATRAPQPVQLILGIA